MEGVKKYSDSFREKAGRSLSGCKSLVLAYISGSETRGGCSAASYGEVLLCCSPSAGGLTHAMRRRGV